MNNVKAMLDFGVECNWHVVLLYCYKWDNVNISLARFSIYSYGSKFLYLFTPRLIVAASNFTSHPPVSRLYGLNVFLLFWVVITSRHFSLSMGKNCYAGGTYLIITVCQSSLSINFVNTVVIISTYLVYNAYNSFFRLK